MGTQANTGPIRRLSRVRERGPFLNQRHDKFMGQMRMRTPMSTALSEAQMRFLRQIINALSCETLKRLRQAFGIIGGGDVFGNISFREFRSMHHQRFMLDQGPFNRCLGTIYLDAFAVLSRHIKQ